MPIDHELNDQILQYTATAPHSPYNTATMPPDRFPGPQVAEACAYLLANGLIVAVRQKQGMRSDYPDYFIHDLTAEGYKRVAELEA